MSDTASTTYVPAPQPGDLPPPMTDARRLLRLEGYIERDPDLREDLESCIGPLGRAFAAIDTARSSRTLTSEGLAQKKVEILEYAKAPFFDSFDKGTQKVAEDAAAQRRRVQHMVLNDDGHTWTIRGPKPLTAEESALVSDIRRHLMTLTPKDARNVFLTAVNAKDYVTVSACESLPPALSFIDEETKAHAERLKFESLPIVLQKSVHQLEQRAAVREAVSEAALRLIRDR